MRTKSEGRKSEYKPGQILLTYNGVVLLNKLVGIHDPLVNGNQLWQVDYLDHIKGVCTGRSYVGNIDDIWRFKNYGFWLNTYKMTPIVLDYTVFRYLYGTENV